MPTDAEIVEAFDKVDLDNSGIITKYELTIAFNDMTTFEQATLVEAVT